MYILSKNKPPMDVDFMVSDTLEMLRPQLTVFASYEEANEAVDRMLLEQLKTVQNPDGSGKSLLEDGFEDSEASDTSLSDGEDEDLDIMDDEEDTMENTDNNVDGDDEEDVVVLKNKKEERSREEEEEFEREFSKMMTDSIDSRKFEKKTAMLDVPIPMNLRGSQGNPIWDFMCNTYGYF